MAIIRKKKSKELPAVNTSSLPDIIFMLLFFFMVATVMREVSLIVKVKSPQATEVQKLEDKSLVSFIYIGKPIKQYRDKMGSNDRIQLNDKFAEPSDIKDYIAVEQTNLPEYKRNKIIVSFKVDIDTKMGIVTDVKQELREANALKINYTSRKGDVHEQN
jgi:biopolymer transport protein ExbD